jgi:putative ABC transport system permease protein
VIGVVADVKNFGIDKPTGTELYLPFKQPHGQEHSSSLYIAARSPGKPSATVSALRREVHELDPTLPLANVRAMGEVMSAVQSRPRFLALLLTLFSSVALALAAVGIYGVISYSVAQRTKEFGVRIALGATPADVLRMVVGSGLSLIAIGVAAGVSGALALTQFFAGLFFGVTPTDPATFVSVSLLLAGLAFLASYIPARRATKVDPMTALRYE